MLIAIPEVLDADGVARVRAAIDAADWVDGNVTSGPQTTLAKRNLQLPEDGAAARAASVLWLQSMVRDDGERRTLFERDGAIQAVAAAQEQDDPAVVRLTGVYHYLLRRWADA